jgi:hypothetical protein
MNKQARSRKSTAKQSARLGAYFAAGVGASMAATSTSEAAIVNINIGPSGFNIGGPNAGLGSGGFSQVSDFPTVGAGAMSGMLGLANGYNDIYWGFLGILGLNFAGASIASPTNFAFNDPIDAGSDFSAEFALFRFDPVEGTPVSAPPFGPGSYIGFRTPDFQYGWLEVLWNGTDEWEILSGAYEDQVGVSIPAGATAPIPEPGTWAALAVLAGGAAFARWRKRKAA